MTLFKDTAFKAVEKLALGKLLDAFETSRKRHLVNGNDEDLIVADDGAALSAVCHLARLCWAHFLCQELADHFGYDVLTRTINQDVHLFTLVDVKCVRPSGQQRVDLDPIVRQLRKGLRGHDYVGVVEPGLYSHISTPDPALKRSACISWHLHALVWGISREEARELAGQLNRSGRFVPIVKGPTGVDQRKVRDGEFSTTLAYLLKRPKHAYRIALNTSAPDEIKYTQYSSKLRPGELLTLYLQLRHVSLPDMWISEGEGRKILTRVRAKSWAAIRRREGEPRWKGKLLGPNRPLYLGRE